MPGLVVFSRRWSVGSDDLVVPGVFLFTIHIIWLIILSIIIIFCHFDKTIYCIELLWYYKLGYLCILIASALIELAICVVSMRGSILDTSQRTSMQYWLYLRVVVLLIDITWLTLGIIWLKNFYTECPIDEPKEIMISLVICNWLVLISILVTIWCTFDPAGRSWVKMKRYQRSESRFNYKRSGSRNRNWRQRKVMRAYQDSWDHRCRLLFCCMGTSERNRNSFTDIARLLSDFFRDLDVVPSDVIAGLVLLRKFQKLEREAIVRQRKNATYEFLSGVPVTQRTQFLALNDSKDYDHFQTVIHYMHFAQGAYGWPMFLMTHSKTGICQLCPELRCCLSCRRSKENSDIIQDNCCKCNYAAMRKMLPSGEIEIIYATYHVDVGETPFFVAIDYTKQKVVISIRGTLSMKDVLTDLNAEGECLPLDPPQEDWVGHKGMVQAAVYIKAKLEEENLIQRGFTHNAARNTQNFGLVLVGHSLGAGTASILAILLKSEYPSLECYSYSPPGGLLSMPAVEYSKSFITSVVVGKDVVPRIGLHQMEALRADLINAIQRSVDPKWKTITCSVMCCGCGPEPTSVVQMSSQDANVNAYKEQRYSTRTTGVHPNDSSIALTLHNPLYPPGKIIHIVRHHPTADEHKYEKGWRQMLKKHEPVYQAIWAENTDFDEVIISPVMLQDHMPDKVLAALNKVITTVGPRKPQRQSSNANSSIASDIADLASFNQDGINGVTTANSPLMSPHNNVTPVASHKLCLETSFTSLQSPVDIGTIGNIGGSSKGSSVAGSLFGKSQLSSILQYDVSSLIDDSGIPKSLSGPSEATTVIMADGRHTAEPKVKNVAFDFSLQPPPPAFNVGDMSPSVAHKTIPILTNNKQPHSLVRKPTSISMNGYRRNSTETPKKLDLIHDDWFGLAPLASPESLSEISSISSRTSFAVSLATSIEKCLHGISLSTDNKMEEIIESQLHTPKIMRRAPKFSENLSKCADDWRSINSYKRMGQIYITNPRVPSNSDSSEQSFESATSICKINPGCIVDIEVGQPQRIYENSKSADNLEEPHGGIEVSAAKWTVSDSAILDNNSGNGGVCISNCPMCPCKSLPPGICCHRFDHSICINLIADGQKASFTNTTSSSDTYYSAMSSLTGSTIDPSPQKNLKPLTCISNINIINNKNNSSHNLLKMGVLESHFPVYPDNNQLTETSERLSLLSSTDSPKKFVQKIDNNKGKIIIHHYQPSSTILTTKKRNLLDDQIFSRNESLPLLVGLNNAENNNNNNNNRITTQLSSTSLLSSTSNSSVGCTGTRSPTNFVRRNKNYVYPVTSTIPSTSTTSLTRCTNIINKKNESNV